MYLLLTKLLSVIFFIRRALMLQCYRKSTHITSDPNYSFLQSIQGLQFLVFVILRGLCATAAKVA